MQEFSSVSVSSYEAGSLSAMLNEKAREGWDVVAIVPTGSSVTAYLTRDASDTPEESEVVPAVVSPIVDTPTDDVQADDESDGADESEDAESEAAQSEAAQSEDAESEADESAEVESDDDTPADDKPVEGAPIGLVAVAADKPAVDKPADDKPGEGAVAGVAGAGATAAVVNEVKAESGSPINEPAGYAAVAAKPPAEPAKDEPAKDEPAKPAAGGAAPAGWYADPSSRYELRYWDGSQWTEHVSRLGQQFTDPPVA